MAEETFISLIQNKKMLYDKTNSNFKNAKVKDAEWEVIGAVFNITGQEAQNKFKALRQKYVREKQIESLETRSGAGASKRVKWSLMPQLKFLDDHIKPRKTCSTLSLSKSVSCAEESLILPLETNEEEQNDNWSEKADMLEAESTLIVDNESVSLFTDMSTPSTSASDMSPYSKTKTPTTFGSKLEPMKKRSKRAPSDQSNDVLSDVIVKLSESLEQSENKEKKDHIQPQIRAFSAYLAEQLQRLPENDAEVLMLNITNMVSQKILENLQK